MSSKVSRPEFFILAVGDSGSHDLPVAVVPDAGYYQDRFGDVSCSVPDFVVGRIHEEVWDRLFDRPQEECLHLVVEVFRHPGDRSRGKLIDPQMTDDLLDSPRRNSLEVGFDDCVHQSFLHQGVAPEDLRLKRKLTELGVPEDCLSVSGLEGSVLVAVPMRFPRIGALVLGSSCLLEGFVPQHLVEEPRDDIQHAGLIIGKIIFD